MGIPLGARSVERRLHRYSEEYSGAGSICSEHRDGSTGRRCYYSDNVGKQYQCQTEIIDYFVKVLTNTMPSAKLNSNPNQKLQFGTSEGSKAIAMFCYQPRRPLLRILGKSKLVVVGQCDFFAKRQ